MITIEPTARVRHRVRAPLSKSQPLDSCQVLNASAGINLLLPPIVHHCLQTLSYYDSLAGYDEEALGFVHPALLIGAFHFHQAAEGVFRVETDELRIRLIFRDIIITVSESSPPAREVDGAHPDSL